MNMCRLPTSSASALVKTKSSQYLYVCNTGSPGLSYAQRARFSSWIYRRRARLRPPSMGLRFVAVFSMR